MPLHNQTYIVGNKLKIYAKGG